MSAAQSDAVERLNAQALNLGQKGKTTVLGDERSAGQELTSDGTDCDDTTATPAQSISDQHLSSALNTSDGFTPKVAASDLLADLVSAGFVSADVTSNSDARLKVLSVIQGYRTRRARNSPRGISAAKAKKRKNSQAP